MAAGVILIFGLLAGGAIWSRGGDIWKWYLGGKSPNEAIAPLLTLATAVGAGAFALMRHFQTVDAERQRRVTESYSKAVEQLSSDKIEQRLGGIYTLERISKESPADYWTIMETLTAFVRERARWREPDQLAKSRIEATSGQSEFQPGPGDKAEKQTAEAQFSKVPPTDIAAVLTVILRRPEAERRREQSEGWRLDLRGADLAGAFLEGAHLERARLSEANLTGALMWKAHLDGANLMWANLNGAYLGEAHLAGADLLGAHLNDANLRAAHLNGADLGAAHLNGATLWGAHLEGVNLDQTTGNAETVLSRGIPRPTSWPAAIHPVSDVLEPVLKTGQLPQRRWLAMK